MCLRAGGGAPNTLAFPTSKTDERHASWPVPPCAGVLRDSLAYTVLCSSSAESVEYMYNIYVLSIYNSKVRTVPVYVLPLYSAAPPRPTPHARRATAGALHGASTIESHRARASLALVGRGWLAVAPTAVREPSQPHPHRPGKGGSNARWGLGARRGWHMALGHRLAPRPPAMNPPYALAPALCSFQTPESYRYRAVPPRRIRRASPGRGDARC